MKTIYILDPGFMKDVVTLPTTIEAFEALERAADGESRPTLYRSRSKGTLDEWTKVGRLLNMYEWIPVDAISNHVPVKVWAHVPKKVRKSS
jgi:hypothetical protein